MKKIFTILLAAGAVTFASAQPGTQKNNPFDNKQQTGFGKGNSGGYNDNDFFSLRDKDAQIKKINREFDQKITAVKWNKRLRPQEKTKQIRMLEMQRKQEIKQVEQRYEKANRKNSGWGNGRH